MSRSTVAASRGARARHPAGRRPPAPVPQPADRARTFGLLLVVIALLNLLGLVMVLSASSVTALYDHGSSWHFFLRQLAWVGVGAVVLAIVVRVDYHRWSRVALPLLVVSLGLLALVLVPGVGVHVNGSTRWLGAGVLQFQPAELAKLAVLLFTADLLARRAGWMDDTRLTLRPVMAVLGAVALLLLMQPNLGTTIVIGAIAFLLLFVAGAPVVRLAAMAATTGLAAVWLSLSEGYRRARVLAFLDPWADPLNAGYQTIQAQVATASGGLTGVGLGASRAKHGFLPYAHTDFIFAVLGEELGLVGSVAVVGLFAAIAVLGVRAALRAPDRLGLLLAGGVTAWFLVQAMVNVGAVVGVLPITGVPLPFVSFGGSSLVVNMAAAGLLLNVSRQGS